MLYGDMPMLALAASNVSKICGKIRAANCIEGYFYFADLEKNATCTFPEQYCKQPFAGQNKRTGHGIEYIDAQKWKKIGNKCSIFCASSFIFESKQQFDYPHGF
ncbi:MAG: hypothetical protein QM642_09235 [Edaphocola sp.]